MSEDIIVKGWGAVSPAGWTARSLADAVLAGEPLAVHEERRCEAAPLRRFRTVPALTGQPLWLRHPRLRRASPAARFLVSAATEAIGSQPVAAGRLGVIFVTTNGSVNFSRKFFAEVIDNPSLASPILFPETVFNAPGSHLSSVLASPAANYTLIGGSSHFIHGIDLAALWLRQGRVSQCLVAAAEEIDWLSTEALMVFPGCKVAAEGAAAMLLEVGDTADEIRLDSVIELAAGQPRESLARALGSELLAGPSSPADFIVCDSRCGSPRLDAAEVSTWAGGGLRALSPVRLLGDGFSLNSGWQCALGCELLRQGEGRTAIISSTPPGEPAAGAVFSR